MPKNYCPSCGSGTDYTLSVPKFCGQCGKPFSQVAVASTPAPAKPKLVPYKDDDDDDDEVADTIKVPRKLDIEWEVQPLQRQTLGSIMQGTDDKAVVDKSGKKLGKKAIKERVEQWRTKLQTTVRREIGGSNE